MYSIWSLDGHLALLKTIYTRHVIHSKRERMPFSVLVLQLPQRLKELTEKA